MHGTNCQRARTIPDNNAPMREGHRWLTLATLCIGVLIAQVDTSVVNLAVQPIGSDLQADVGALQWVVDSYNLVYAVLLLSGGLLADLYGRRLTFMAGAAVFTAASLLCAFAPSTAILVGGRALTGVGAALLLPASLAIIRVAWPDAKERARAMGIWAGCNGLAFVIGPTLGGMLIARFGWRSIFLVVVPFGLTALTLAPPAIAESSDPHGRHFDAAGQLFGALALGGFAVAAIESHGAWQAAIVALALAALSLGLFLKIEARRGDAALVPPDIFRAPAFRGAMVATTGMTFGMYGVLFLTPLTWQNAGMLGPIGAGVGLMPMAVVFMLVSPFSGALKGKFGTAALTGGGVAVIGCGLLLIGAMAPARSIAATEIGLTLTGLGMGLATGPLMDTAVSTVRTARAGTAAALINVARMVGATVGVAVLGAVFALGGGETYGLLLAMLLGGTVQLASAAVVWMATRLATDHERPEPS